MSWIHIRRSVVKLITSSLRTSLNYELGQGEWNEFNLILCWLFFGRRNDNWRDEWWKVISNVLWRSSSFERESVEDGIGVVVGRRRRKRWMETVFWFSPQNQWKFGNNRDSENHTRKMMNFIFCLFRLRSLSILNWPC